MLAHHRPSGKLIVSSSKEFATGLFSKSRSLLRTCFLAKTKGLPKQGTAISYLSPVLMTELRKFIKEAIEAENPPEDDLFGHSMLDFFLPEGALGEAMVTTGPKMVFFPLEIQLILINQKFLWVLQYRL